MVNCNIQIEDKVYIGGVLDENLKIINNKVGEVKRIMFSSSEYYATYIADVMINNEIYSINFSFIYKLDDLDTYQYNELFDLISLN